MLLLRFNATTTTLTTIATTTITHSYRKLIEIQYRFICFTALSFTLSFLLSLSKLYLVAFYILQNSEFLHILAWHNVKIKELISVKIPENSTKR